jgi:thioesterase domain-containing protein
VVELRPGSTGAPFFFVHPSSGNVECYLELVRQMAPGYAYYGLRSHGLDGDNEPDTQVEAMAARYVEQMTQILPVGPYRLCGWSMGGLVAFEMARQLSVQGEKVDVLVLLDIGVLDFRGRTDTQNDAELLAEVLADHMPLALDGFWQLDDEARLHFLMEQAKRAGLVPAGLEPSDLTPYVNVSRANVRAARDFRPLPYPGRITLLRAGDRPADRTQDPHLGWDEVAGDGVELHVTPGQHFTILRAPQVQALAGLLNECLDRVHPRPVHAASSDDASTRRNGP